MRLLAVFCLAAVPACCLAASVAAGPPILQQQFGANVTDTLYVDGVNVRTLWQMFHFDVPGQRWRVENTGQDGKNNTQIYDLKNNSAWYLITDASGSVELCHKLPVQAGLVQPPLFIDPSAVNLGPSSVSGLSTERWGAHLTDPSGRPFDEFWQVQDCKDCAPMELSTNVTFNNTGCSPWKSGPCVTSDVRDNTRDLVTGPMPDWYFSIGGIPCNDRVAGEHGGFKEPIGLSFGGMLPLDVLHDKAIFSLQPKAVAEPARCPFIKCSVDSDCSPGPGPGPEPTPPPGPPGPGSCACIQGPLFSACGPSEMA